MLPSWCQDSVTIVRPATKTVRGVDVPDWANASRHAVAGCSLQRSASETEFDGAQRDAASSRATLLCPEGSDVRQGDRIESGGRTWSVDGVPFPVASPTGRTSHLYVSLVEWRG